MYLLYLAHDAYVHGYTYIATYAYIHAYNIPYTAKLLRGKTFTVVCKIHYSLENFRIGSGCDHHVLHTTSDSRGKLSRSAENLRKPLLLKSFAVYGTYIQT